MHLIDFIKSYSMGTDVLTKHVFQESKGLLLKSPLLIILNWRSWCGSWIPARCDVILNLDLFQLRKSYN